MNKRIKLRWFLLVTVLIVLIFGTMVFMNTLSRTYIAVIGEIKGTDKLSWEDFDQFPHEDIGSGRYVYKYNLSDGGSLFIIGDSLDKLPSTIYITEKDGSETMINK
ncbi:hypothetical protein [Microaceticoccus formicicus]|uniref:hypothetical protein n=1 Tax=Microaceticoccus formicicus TaxID=3118105 RepID=UPI003CCFF74E|nr:hypothetical protein VZL98_06465 [Peptoniphilaceae bacterium AMB_02]